MATKIAIVIGDYSNGWSDAIIVQAVLAFEKVSQVNEDREYVLGKMNDRLLQLIREIESNDKVNPKPKDQPCCAGFKEWFKEANRESKFCGMCATAITKERVDSIPF